MINIIDFRDTDATMTHWAQPRRLHRGPAPAQAPPVTSPYLVLAPQPADDGHPLDQYGMEYNPIAINEVLAYSFQQAARRVRRTGSSSSW